MTELSPMVKRADDLLRVDVQDRREVDALVGRNAIRGDQGHLMLGTAHRITIRGDQGHRVGG